MEITIFAKKRQTKEGKTFYNYLTTLNRNDGTKQTMGVKFTEECDPIKPDLCPCNIVVKKENCNVALRDYTRDNGEPATGYTLWIKAYTAGSAYVDHSMDEYDFD